MGLRNGPRRRPAGTVNDQVSPERLPVGERLQRIVVWDLAPADKEALIRASYLFVPAAVVSINFKQCRQGRDVFDIGDRNRNKPLLPERCSQQRATDAAKAMYCD